MSQHQQKPSAKWRRITPMSTIKRAAMLALAVMIVASPARAENVVLEEFRNLMPAGQTAPPQWEKIAAFFEELDALSVDEYREFPTLKPENRLMLDRMAFLLNDPAARSQICFEAQQKLYQLGPLAYRMQVLFELGEMTAARDEDGNPKITGEAVVGYHSTKARFECVRPF